MLSFKMITSSEGAAKYFENTDDYYTQKGHKGEWSGKAAEALGLKGGVSRDDFKNMLDGYLTTTGQKVRNSTRMDAKERKGIDFTFSAPKSVSIQALINGDERMLVAHDVAVKSALINLEKLAASRKKKNRISSRENTENLVIASFRHELSREQDPQIHTHNIVMNLTQRDDGEWRALSNEQMLDNVKVLGAIYKSELADNIKKLGYGLRETKSGWELKHVSNEAITLFSKRSNQIEKVLNAQGVEREEVNGKEKQLITMNTRKKKQETDRKLLHNSWIEEAKQAGVSYQLTEQVEGFVFSQYGEENKTMASTHDKLVSWEKGYIERQDSAYRSVMFAIDHLGERQGIIEKSELLATAYEYGVITNTKTEIDNALSKALKDGVIHVEPELYQTAESLNTFNSNGDFKEGSLNERITLPSWVELTAAEGYSQDKAQKIVEKKITAGELVRSEERYATSISRKTEISILAIERVGRESVIPLFDKEQRHRIGKGGDLNEGQRSAVDLVLGTQNRYVGIQGIAGTGKSHMLSHLVKNIEDYNLDQPNDMHYKIVGVAPYTSQTKALGQLGMKADTLASFLINSKKQDDLNSRSIVILDEASVVPAKDMLKLMRIVENKDARLIMNGDIKQTQAIEAGKPFEQLQNVGMTTAYLTDIKRQKDKRLKKAVEFAATEDIKASLSVLKQDVIQVGESQKRYETIADKYVSYSIKEREGVLIVAGTNDARTAINLSVREKLGLSGGEDVRILTKVDMTRAQAKNVRYYSTGMIIVSAIKSNQLEKNKQYTVSAIKGDTNTLRLIDSQGEEIKLDPAKAKGMKVFNDEIIKPVKGEYVQITDNKRDLNLTNGDKYRVVSNTQKAITLDVNGKNVTMPKDEALPLRYSYATTIHSAQGLTSDRVLIDSDVNSKTSNRSVYYVAISRPRYGVEIYTNNKSKLARAMGREQKKSAALDLHDSYNDDLNMINISNKAKRDKLSKNIRPEHIDTPQRERIKTTKPQKITL